MPAATALPAPLFSRAFDLPDEAATIAFGQRVAQGLALVRANCAANTQEPDDVSRQIEAAQDFAGLQIHLLGDLGAGKTTLVRAMLHALGHIGRVRSPTYTLVEPYLITRHDTPLNVYHFDLYRFADPAEWADAGFRDYFGSGALCLVEWPQQAGNLLGIPDLIFALELKPATHDEYPKGTSFGASGADPAAEADGTGRTLAAHAYTEIGKKCLERC